MRPVAPDHELHHADAGAPWFWFQFCCDQLVHRREVLRAAEVADVESARRRCRRRRCDSPPNGIGRRAGVDARVAGLTSAPVVGFRLDDLSTGFSTRRSGAASARASAAPAPTSPAPSAAGGGSTALGASGGATACTGRPESASCRRRSGPPRRRARSNIGVGFARRLASRQSRGIRTTAASSATCATSDTTTIRRGRRSLRIARARTSLTASCISRYRPSPGLRHQRPTFSTPASFNLSVTSSRFLHAGGGVGADEHRLVVARQNRLPHPLLQDLEPDALLVELHDAVVRKSAGTVT